MLKGAQAKGSVKGLLPLVRRPGRYVGGEVNSIKKDLSAVALKFGLAFPDAYEVGMSHLGMQILYQTLNAREDIACERVFAPWTDMEAVLRERGRRLSTLESEVPLNELDILGFSLQYELSYTNVLNMLDLGGVPLLAKDRKAGDPFVIGGGPVVYNPEPVADFFDCFLLGDGEEAVLEISDAITASKAAKEERAAALRRLSRIRGVYVPSFFEVRYNGDGTVKETAPLIEGYTTVKKRVTPDINDLPLLTRPVVPFVETIHDRVTVEITRGCTRGCRFCQAGMIYRPIRERRPEAVIELINGALKNTGYDEVSLLSLSAGDYTLIEELLASLMKRFVKENVALSLPSLRVGTLGARVAEQIKKVRKTGFTLAPEAGSDRLRKLINKGIREEDLIKGSKEVFSLGWRLLKLYFMIGLPTETDEDLTEILRLAGCVKKTGKEAGGGKKIELNVAISTFIPKPFTPFQWEPQLSVDECVRRQALLKSGLAGLKLGFKWHDPSTSLLEGVFSRGDRRLSRVILTAFNKGCRFDGWSEEFKFRLWQEAFAECGLDMDFYAARRRPFDEVFPWDHLDAGIKKEFLCREYENAVGLSYTPDCKTDRCAACGVCDHKTIKNVVAKDGSCLTDASVAMEKTSSRLASPARDAHKIRLFFSKTGDMRFLGHLELVSVFTRALRRAGVPIRYSEGFHPLPRLVFSPPLPMGIESMDEYLDIEVEEAGGNSPEAVKERLGRELPPGLRLLSSRLIPLKLIRSSDIIKAVEYRVFLKGYPVGEFPLAGLNIGPEAMDGVLRDFIGREKILIAVSMQGKPAEVDVKPLIGAVALEDGGTLKLILKKGEPHVKDGHNVPAGVRPADVLASLFNIPVKDASLIPVLKTRTIL